MLALEANAFHPDLRPGAGDATGEVRAGWLRAWGLACAVQERRCPRCSARMAPRTTIARHQDMPPVRGDEAGRGAGKAQGDEGGGEAAASVCGPVGLALPIEGDSRSNDASPGPKSAMKVCGLRPSRVRRPFHPLRERKRGQVASRDGSNLLTAKHHSAAVHHSH